MARWARGETIVWTWTPESPKTLYTTYWIKVVRGAHICLSGLVHAMGLAEIFL